MQQILHNEVSQYNINNFATVFEKQQQWYPSLFTDTNIYRGKMKSVHVVMGL